MVFLSPVIEEAIAASSNSAGNTGRFSTNSSPSLLLTNRHDLCSWHAAAWCQRSARLAFQTAKCTVDQA